MYDTSNHSTIPTEPSTDMEKAVKGKYSLPTLISIGERSLRMAKKFMENNHKFLYELLSALPIFPTKTNALPTVDDVDVRFPQGRIREVYAADTTDVDNDVCDIFIVTDNGKTVGYDTLSFMQRIVLFQSVLLTIKRLQEYEKKLGNDDFQKGRYKDLIRKVRKSMLVDGIVSEYHTARRKMYQQSVAAIGRVMDAIGTQKCDLSAVKPLVSLMTSPNADTDTEGTHVPLTHIKAVEKTKNGEILFHTTAAWDSLSVINALEFDKDGNPPFKLSDVEEVLAAVIKVSGV